MCVRDRVLCTAARDIYISETERETESQRERQGVGWGGWGCPMLITDAGPLDG